MIEFCARGGARSARPNLKQWVRGCGDHLSYGASFRSIAQRDRSVLPAYISFETIDLAHLRRHRERQVLGGGLELASFCNWIFAAPDAQLAQPEIRLGVFAPIASLLLRERVGRPAAEVLCLTGQVLGAEDALDLGLVDYVAEDPTAAADAWIELNLLPHSAVALHHATRAVRLPLRESLLRDLDEVERIYLRELMRTEDAREGIAAFLEKRPARGKNH